MGKGIARAGLMNELIANIIREQAEALFVPEANDYDHSMAVSTIIFGHITLELVDAGETFEDAMLNYDVTDRVRKGMELAGFDFVEQKRVELND